jgi:2-haloacid dehalogenase
MSPPTIVVFDIGHVLIEWDPRHLYRKLFAGDDARVEWFLREVCPPAWNYEQDRGRPWADAVAEAAARHPTMAAEIAAYRDRWHEMVPGEIAGSVALLRALAARGVPLYAITNFAADTFAEVVERFPFFSLFRGIVVSGTERVVKPGAEIFRLLASRYGLALEDCLFIDDVPANVAGAQAVGMHGHHFTAPEALAAALMGYGLLPTKGVASPAPKP